MFALTCLCFFPGRNSISVENFSRQITVKDYISSGAFWLRSNSEIPIERFDSPRIRRRVIRVKNVHSPGEKLRTKRKEKVVNWIESSHMLPFYRPYAEVFRNHWIYWFPCSPEEVGSYRLSVSRDRSRKFPHHCWHCCFAQQVSQLLCPTVMGFVFSRSSRGLKF